MPPTNRYHQQVSSPFTHINQQSIHPSSHLQHHPSANVQPHNLGAHHGFGANGGMSLFGPHPNSGALPGFAPGGLGAGNGTGLGQAAQMGFGQSGLTLPHPHDAASVGNGSSAANARIREVWKDNLEHEFAVLRKLIQRYHFISMVSSLE